MRTGYCPDCRAEVEITKRGGCPACGRCVGITRIRLLDETKSEGQRVLRQTEELIARTGDSMSAPVAGVSLAAELRELTNMAAEGLLSPADLERAKDALMGKTPDQRHAAIESLAALHALHKQGVLSESEFNMKKWDILSRS